MDISILVQKGTDLYLVAPLFFNWAASIVLATISGLIWLAYWLGRGNSAINGVWAHIFAVDQRFNLAKEQAALSTKEATNSKIQLEKLRQEIDNRAPTETLQRSTAVLDGNLNRLLTANTSVSKSLGQVSIGFDKNGQLIWRPIEPGTFSSLMIPAGAGAPPAPGHSGTCLNVGHLRPRHAGPPRNRLNLAPAPVRPPSASMSSARRCSSVRLWSESSEIGIAALATNQIREAHSLWRSPP
jgi:hypothetical protein